MKAMNSASATAADAAPGGTPEKPPLLVPLARPDTCVGAPLRAEALLGRKAAALAQLARAGFAVPEGMVLTTEAYAEGDGDTFSPAVQAAISEIIESFGDATLAVRSSSMQEDQPTASFAGQYDTVLGVRGAAQLGDAVRRCWDSVSGTRVRTYPAAPSQPAPAAVLIQRQLAPDIAGVAFTADPVTGDRSRVLVSAAPGLGDAVVDGRLTPDEWTVGESATPVRASHGALTADLATAVAVLARRIESFFGVPQDIEWAMDGGRLFVLQARPITALPTQPRLDLPAGGTWLKETERYVEPMTALGASLATVLVAHGLTAMFTEFGGLMDRVDCRSVGGEIYLRMVPLGGSGSPPPWFVLSVLARTVPRLRARMRTAKRMAAPARLAALSLEWERRGRAELQTRIDALHRVPLRELDDAQLAAHLHEVRHLIQDAMATHFRMTVPETVPLHQLVVMCRRVLGWDDAQSLRLVAGTSTTTSEPSRAIAAIAAEVQNMPNLVQSLRSGGDPQAALSAASPELGEVFARWCALYAERCMNDDPGSATLAEQPLLLANLLLDAPRIIEDRANRATGLRTDARARARSVLAARRGRVRRRFEATLAAAERAYGLREDVAFWTASKPAALVRRAAMEAGRRLVVSGRIDRVEDCVQLDFGTLVAALDPGDAPPIADLRSPIAQAKAERAWVRRHPGPAFIGAAPTPPPNLRGLPRIPRALGEALLWSRFGTPAATGKASGPAVPADGAFGLVGIAGSPGRATGRVCIVRGDADFAKLRSGDVLVTHTTDPAWSVLFGIAGGLVTNAGGVLSHAAIVAREHGIPAVLGTGTATRTLHDGDVVTVDGTAGVVRVQPGSSTPAGHEDSRTDN